MAAAADPTIDVAFVEEFEAGIHMAYQRMGSKFRNTIRTRAGVKNKTTFQKAGKGEATQKARHGKVKPMNLPHTNVNVTVEDWFAGEWIDDLDLLRINHDEMLLAQESGAGALGRKTDDQIIDAMETSTSALDETTNGATLPWATQNMENFGNNDVPDDGRRIAMVAWENWGQLLAIPQFASQDYVPTDMLPFTRGTQGKMWLSFLWMPFSGFDDLNAGADKRGLSYHFTSTGHAIGSDIRTTMQFHNDYDSWFVNNKMQMNAVLIDENGCFTHELKK